MQTIKAVTKYDLARCIQVRTLVFTVGQNVPRDREVDAHEDECHHFLVLDDDNAIGTGRWRIYKDGKAKIERMAVLDEARGKGAGRALLVAMLEDIQQHKNISEVILSSQDHAIPFYESFGFKAFGDGYMDGGTIPHHDMALQF